MLPGSPGLPGDEKPVLRGHWPTPTSARNEHSSWSTPSLEAEVAQTTGGPQARASWWERGTFSLGCTILTVFPQTHSARVHVCGSGLHGFRSRGGVLIQ